MDAEIVTSVPGASLQDRQGPVKATTLAGCERSRHVSYLHGKATLHLKLWQAAGAVPLTQAGSECQRPAAAIDYDHCRKR